MIARYGIWGGSVAPMRWLAVPRRPQGSVRPSRRKALRKCCVNWMRRRCSRLLMAVIFRWRSEEHTSELQSLMRISYAVFCLKKKKKTRNNTVRIRQIKLTHRKYGEKQYAIPLYYKQKNKNEQHK